MSLDIGLVTDGNNSYFYDITHSFKIDSSTYHVLGLRRDQPTYGNTYYIFQCENCTPQKTRHGSAVNKSLPSIVPSRKGPDRSSATQTKTKSDARLVVSIETAISNLLKTEHQALIKSVRKTIQGEHKTMLESIEKSSKKVEGEAAKLKEKMNEILEKEHQTVVDSIHNELQTENKTLVESIKNDQNLLVQECTKNTVNKEELTALFKEQQLSLQSIYEKQITVINSSVNQLTETIHQTASKASQISTNDENQTSTTLTQFQLTLIQAVQKEVHHCISKTVEKFESLQVQILELQQTIQQNVVNIVTGNISIDVFNTLFTEQKNILIKAVEQQATIWNRHLRAIIREALTENGTSPPGIGASGYLGDGKSVTTGEPQKYPQSETTGPHGSGPMIAIKPQRDVSGVLAASQNADSLKPINSDSITSGSTDGFKLEHTKQISTTLNSAYLTDQNLFKISIKSPEPVHLFAKIDINGVPYPRKSHTLCQKDPCEPDIVSCYVAPPPINGPYNVTIYAKTNHETAYRAAIALRIPGANVTQTAFFPYTFPIFEAYQCSLLQPLQSFLRYNDHVLIHMFLPGAKSVKIQNGDENVVIRHDEYLNGELKKQIEVRGDVFVYGRWNDEADSTVCFFYVV